MLFEGFFAIGLFQKKLRAGGGRVGEDIFFWKTLECLDLPLYS